MVTIRKNVPENKMDSFKEAELNLVRGFDLKDFSSYMIENAPNTIKELVEESLREQGFPKEVRWSDVDWHLKTIQKKEFKEWVELGLEKGYILESDLEDGLRNFIREGKTYEMAIKEWDKSGLLEFEVALNEDMSSWENRMNYTEHLVDSFHDLLDILRVNATVKENIEIYPELESMFYDLTREIGLEDATVRDTQYKVEVNVNGQEEELAILITLLLNINDPDRLKRGFQMNSDDFNTMLCIPSLFAKVNKRLTVLDDVQAWEERNQRVASKRKALEAIQRKLEESFEPVVVGAYLSNADNLVNAENPYFAKAVSMAEEEGLSLEQFLAKRQVVTAKLKGDLSELCEELLNSELSNYAQYKAFLSTPINEVQRFWLKKPYMKFIDVDVKMV